MLRESLQWVLFFFPKILTGLFPNGCDSQKFGRDTIFIVTIILLLVIMDVFCSTVRSATTLEQSDLARHALQLSHFFPSMKPYECDFTN